MNNEKDPYALIKQILKKRTLGVMNASASDLEEEKKLALAKFGDEADEENGESFLSPAMADATKPLRQSREDESEFLLSAKEKSILSQELGKPIGSFGLKAAQGAEGDEKIPDLNYEELEKFADEIAPLV